MYPYPVQSQKCDRYGRWSPLRTPTGGTAREVVCKWINCPDPSRLEHGSVEPMLGEYLVGNSTSYTCFEGYQLRGSPTRTCQPNGKWSGETPICDNGCDSGGSLFLEKKRRMFQVGVISWGNKNLCVGGRRQPTEKDSRDYHINLFEVQDFLRDKLGTNEPKYLNFIK
ncbi:UNVERIFIED_CONTAM: hypothetical protein FKN15_070322 [Acipenser sinensis]